MKRIFPPMDDRPEKWMPAAVLGYWIFAFSIIPVWLPLITDGFWGDRQFNAWLDIIYHAVNAVVVVAILKGYAGESLLEVQLYPQKFLKTVGIAVLLMLVLALSLYFLLGDYLWNFYPIQEMTIAAAPGVMVDELPVLGVLCHVVLTPIAVTGLFYAGIFAPLCCRKTWLGYLGITLLLMIPCVLEVLWRGMSWYVIPTYLLQLPMHLIACWSYQKTNTVWAPVATLAIFNLTISLSILLPL